MCIGTLDTENVVHMKIGIRKRLSFIFSYGGQVGDLQEVLSLIQAGEIRPHVDEAMLEDFPTILADLVDGKVRSRIALMHV